MLSGCDMIFDIPTIYLGVKSDGIADLPQQYPFGKNRGAGLVYRLSSLPVATGLNKPLYSSTNQWEKDIYESSQQNTVQATLHAEPRAEHLLAFIGINSNARMLMPRLDRAYPGRCSSDVDL